MRALILAAGRGSRMRHLTQDRPKGLTPLGGVPLIERQCAALRAAGVTQIGIVTGYMAERFAPYADATFHNPRWADTQMVTSLEAAGDWLRGAPALVSYSDIFFEPDMARALVRSDAALAITYDPDWQAQWTGRFGDPLIDAETFRMAPGPGQGQGADGRRVLREIGRSPTNLSQIEGQYMGLLRFTPAGWAAALAARDTLDAAARDAQSMTGLLDQLTSRGIAIDALPTPGRWGEIDSVEDLEFFERSGANGQ